MEGNAEFQELPQEKLKPESQSLGEKEVNWLRRLKGRFNLVFSRERKLGETFPKIAVDIFYSAHIKSALEGRFEEMFKKADIYIPEAGSWDPISLGTIRSISDGKRKPRASGAIKAPFADFLSKLEEIIYNSHKPITLIDVPRSNPLVGRKEPPFTPPLVGDFSDSLDSIRGFIKRDVDFHMEREGYMLFKLKPKIQEILEAYPLLKQKKEVRVLLSLGSFHTSIYHNLKKTSQTVTREFKSMPDVNSFFSEAEKRAIFGKEISKELYAKVFLEMIFGEELYSLFKDIENYGATEPDRLIRNIISQFSFEDTEYIFDRLKQGDNASQLFETKLREKDIAIPQTKQELDEFLAKPLPPRPKGREGRSEY